MEKTMTPSKLLKPLRSLHDWSDNETVLVARSKAHPTGPDPLDPVAACRAIAGELAGLALRCPLDHYLKRLKVRRERLDKGRGYYLEAVFAPRG